MSPEEQEKLVLDNQKLVPHIALEFTKIPETLDELIGEGTIALVEASKAYKEEKGTFQSYAGTIIRNRMKKYLRKLLKNIVSVESIISPDGASLLDILVDPDAMSTEDKLIKQEQLETMREAWEVLSHKEMFVVARYFGLNGLDPLTLEEIGAYLDCSKQNIHYILKQSLKLLKKEMIRD